MSEALEMAKFLVEPVTKLIGAVQDAIGVVYEPRHVRKMAEAKAYEIDTIAQAIRNNSDLPVVYDEGNLLLDSSEINAFAQRMQNRVAVQELRKQANIESVLDQSHDILADEAPVTGEPVDPDWVMRFLNFAGEVSNHEMQRIWALILTGEIKKPGSFSLRTLETIRNLTQSEAKIFDKIVPLVLEVGDKFVISSNKEVLNKYGVQYNDILTLHECGLIVSNQSLTFSFKLDKGDHATVHTDSFSVVLEGNKEGEVALQVYTLSQAGKELVKSLSYEDNLDYLRDFLLAEQIKNNNIFDVKFDPLSL